MNTRRAWLAGILCVTAGLLGVLTVSDAAAQVGSGSGSRSGMVSHVGAYTVMTSDAGNEDIVVVLDTRNEQLMAYRVDSAGIIQLQQKVGLPKLFSDARAKSMGVK